MNNRSPDPTPCSSARNRQLVVHFPRATLVTDNRRQVSPCNPFNREHSNHGRSARFVKNMNWNPLELLGTHDQPNERQHHILPHPEGWAVARSGAKRPARVCATKFEAMEAGIRIARNQAGILVIHGRDGTVQEQRDYS